MRSPSVLHGLHPILHRGSTCRYWCFGCWLLLRLRGITSLPRKREGSRRAEAASACLWRAENAAACRTHSCPSQKPAVRAYRPLWGPLGVWGDPLCPLGPPMFTHVRPMIGRCPAPRSTSPHACCCRLAFPSAVCSPRGLRFRFLPLFVTYLELNRHGISRKRENADIDK